MAACINKNHPEYLDLISKMGPDCSEFMVEALSRIYTEKYGRFPHPDEIPGFNSEPHLRETLEVNTHNAATIDKILETTGTSSIEEANVLVNKDHSDLEVEFFPIGKKAMVSIEKRPTSYTNAELDKNFDVGDINSALAFNTFLDKCAKLYGINIIPTTRAEITHNLLEIAPVAVSAAAFVYNDNIYINTDVASVDAPLHEMMHLFLGSMRYTNPDLYSQLVSQSEQLPNYEEYLKKYPYRTRNDINEEILVELYSKFLTGLSSEFDNIDDSVKHEILYNINRMLDTMFMGKVSVSAINGIQSMSLKDIANRINSTEFVNTFKGTMTDAHTHRVVANTKTDLMKKGELKEYCD